MNEQKTIELKKVVAEKSRVDTCARTAVNMLAGFGLYCLCVSCFRMPPMLPGIALTTAQAEEAQEDERLANLAIEIEREKKQAKQRINKGK